MVYRRIAIALFLVLAACLCNECIVWFLVAPWSYAELWLKYFTFLYVVVVATVVFYLAVVIPRTPALDPFFEEYGKIQGE